MCGASTVCSSVITSAKDSDGNTVYTATATLDDGQVITDTKTVEPTVTYNDIPVYKDGEVVYTITGDDFAAAQADAESQTFTYTSSSGTNEVTANFVLITDLLGENLPDSGCGFIATGSDDFTTTFTEDYLDKAYIYYDEDEEYYRTAVDGSRGAYWAKDVVSFTLGHDYENGVCIICGAEEPEEESYDVKYAVSIWGIEQDVDENGNKLGLTFGPATGASHLNDSVSCDSENCIHKLSWDEIIEQSKTDPTVFESCLQNGCTKSVDITLSTTLLNESYNGKMDSGDGATVIYNSIKSDYLTWNDNSTNAGGWPASKIRTTLNGEDGVISGFPSELQDGIVAKAVKSDTVYDDTSANNGTTYDKLWLFSGKEIYTGGSYTVTIRDNEGQVYQRSENLGIVTDDNEAQLIGYSEENAMNGWWLRSISKNRDTQVAALVYVQGDYYGDDDNADATKYGFSPGFCLAGPEEETPHTHEWEVEWTWIGLPKYVDCGVEGYEPLSVIQPLGVAQNLSIATYAGDLNDVTATAVATCSGCGDTETVKGELAAEYLTAEPTDYVGALAQITATATFSDEQTATDEKKVVAAATGNLEVDYVTTAGASPTDAKEVAFSDINTLINETTPFSIIYTTGSDETTTMPFVKITDILEKYATSVDGENYCCFMPYDTGGSSGQPLSHDAYIYQRDQTGTYYYRTAENDAYGQSWWSNLARIEVVSQHDWGTPTWTWADDYSSASVTVSCTRKTSRSFVVCTHSCTADATISESEADGYTTYTATATLDDGQVITDEQTVETPEAETVKYAVKIWGIGTDKDEKGNTLGLTFGPALGNTNYTTTYTAHLTEEQYEAGEGKCIHWMTWEEIIETDPNEFAACKTNGCTKAVEITPNEKLFNPTVVAAAQDYITGDGVTTLYRLLAGEGSYSYGAIWNYSYSGASANDPASVYSKSRIRVTLNGDATDAELKYASSDGTGSDLCNEKTCLLSCFPEELQDAISPRDTVNAGLTVDWGYNTSFGDVDTYDKLWLPSSVEAGADMSSQGYYDGGGTSYGVNSNLRAYEFNSDASSSTAVNWWTRSRSCSGNYSAYYISSSGSATSSSTITYGYGVSPCFSLPVPASAEATPTVADVKILTNLEDNATSKTYDGEGITLNVSATTSPDDATVTYQWYKDGEEVEPTSLMPSEMLIRPYAMVVQPYATSTSSYTTGSNVSDSGTYKCEVTVTSGGNSVDASGSIDISIAKATQSIEFTDASVEKTTDDTSFTNAITEDSVVFGDVTYSTGDETVATVDEKTGEVTIVGAGTTTITATAAGSNEGNYDEVSNAYELTVTGAEASTTWTKVQYAVKIYGINKDTYSTDGGNTKETAALTFGPATGKDYTNSYVECDSDYCIHKLTWQQIIDQCAEDATVFNSCLTNGCTKAVELTPNDTIFNETTVTNALAAGYTGDGVGTLHSLMKDTYTVWNTTTSENIYSKSRVRITLNGNTSDAGDAAGTGLCDSTNCLLSCFPSELQSAIVPRETENSNSSNSSTAGDTTTYDKLFLLSLKETGDTSTNSNDDSGGEDYGVNSSATVRTVYEFSDISASSTEEQYWWTRSRYSGSNYYAYEMNPNGYGYFSMVWYDAGISPAFCIPGASSSESEPEPDNDSYNVKYAVSVWGIQQDKDESGNSLGLTFGPATGADYTGSYVSRETEGANDHGSTYCIHDMTWSEIIAQSKEDPTVFEDCLENGCTKAVNLTLNEDLLGTDYSGEMENGDGAGVLYNSIAADYRKWNAEGGNVYGNTGGWPASRMRVTLNGDASDAGSYAGDNLCNSSNCLLSCFPTDLQNAIVAKAVQTGTVYSTQSEENAKTTYDKLWLFSGAEVFGDSGSNNSVIHSYEGSLYKRSSEFYITTSNHNDLINYEETGAAHTWWLRTIPTSSSANANIISATGDWTSHSVTGNSTSEVGVSFGFCLS